MGYEWNSKEAEMQDNSIPPSPRYVYQARILNVHDGDTVAVEVDHGFRLYSVQALRLKDVHAPELNEPGGQESRMHLLQLLNGPAAPLGIVFRTHKDGMSFNRYVADMWAYLDATVNVYINALQEEWMRQQGYGLGN